MHVNWVQLAAIVGFLSTLGGVLVWPGRVLSHWLRHTVQDVVTEVVDPYLTNGERTVANYAHDAADAARTASKAAEDARDAAYSARTAALETKEIVLTMRDGR